MPRDNMADEAIAVENLGYTCDDLLADDHFSFSMTKGEIFNYSGPDGAGLLFPTDTPIDRKNLPSVLCHQTFHGHH